MNVMGTPAGLWPGGLRSGMDPQADADTKPSQIKLLKFVTAFGIGGTEQQIANLTRMLDRSRFDLRMGCLKCWGDFLGGIEKGRIPVSEYAINRLYHIWTFKQQMRLASDIRRYQIQIVHSYNFYANAFAIPAAKLAGAPVTIASIRDAGVYLTPAKRRVQRVLCRWADCILVNAEAIKEWLAGEGYSPNKITVIKNGIDLSRFSCKNGSAGLREEFGLPGHGPLVVMLSRLNPQKGVEYFLEAAAYVRQRCPEACFLLVGDAVVHQGGVTANVAYRRALEQRAARLGLGRHVIFTGFRTDVPELLSAATVSVLPSFSEGLSNALLESMAAGVPVVATRVGGNPEVIEHEKGGLLVPPRDSRALGEAIQAILENPDLARKVAEEGRRRVAEDFSLERMVRETEDLYVRLLEEKEKRKKPAA